MSGSESKPATGADDGPIGAPTAVTASTPLLDSLIHPDTLAERLGVKRRSVDEWRITGKGPAFIRIGRTVRYTPEAVDDWLRSRQYTSTSEER